MQTPASTARPTLRFGVSPTPVALSGFSTYDVSRTVANIGGVGSGTRLTFSSMSSPAARNTTSVIAAFRELQAKAKGIESERIASMRERDNLQRQLDDLKKNSHLWHSHAEIEARNSLLNFRAASETAKTRMSELELKYLSLDDTNKSILRSIALHREHARALQQEVSSTNSDAAKLERETAGMKKDVEHVELRCQKVRKESIRSPDRHQKQQDRIGDALDDVSNEIEYVKAATDRTRLRCEAMQRYMEMLLNINGDLCRKMVGIFDTKDGVKTIAKAFSPPRYQWPKEVPYEDTIDALSEAAILHSRAEREALAAEVARTSAVATKHLYKVADKATKRFASSHRPQSAPPATRVSAGRNNKKKSSVFFSTPVSTHGQPPVSNTPRTQSSIVADIVAAVDESAVLRHAARFADAAMEAEIEREQQEELSSEDDDGGRHANTSSTDIDHILGSRTLDAYASSMNALITGDPLNRQSLTNVMTNTRAALTAADPAASSSATSTRRRGTKTNVTARRSRSARSSYSASVPDVRRNVGISSEATAGAGALSSAVKTLATAAAAVARAGAAAGSPVIVHTHRPMSSARAGVYSVIRRRGEKSEPRTVNSSRRRHSVSGVVSLKNKNDNDNDNGNGNGNGNGAQQRRSRSPAFVPSGMISHTYNTIAKEQKAARIATSFNASIASRFKTYQQEILDNAKVTNAIAVGTHLEEIGRHIRAASSIAKHTP